jgi:hypothetical protein
MVNVSGTNAYLNIPYDRFYMDEFDAPAAESAYHKASRREKRTAHVVVRMRRGFGVLENLFIDDVPIQEYLERDKDQG